MVVSFIITDQPESKQKLANTLQKLRHSMVDLRAQDQTRTAKSRHNRDGVLTQTTPNHRSEATLLWVRLSKRDTVTRKQMIEAGPWIVARPWLEWVARNENGDGHRDGD